MKCKRENVAEQNGDKMPAHKLNTFPRGDYITIRRDGGVETPPHPVIAFIEGDGIGPDVWHASRFVFDSAVKHCYGGTRSILWAEVFAGTKAKALCGDYLPGETIEAMRTALVTLKGPLTTPVGGGFRSATVRLRQELDLYACVRPVRYFEGVPSPVRHPEKVDMLIYRENTEDVYTGFELEEGTPAAGKLISLLQKSFGWQLSPDSGIAVKPISKTKSKRIVRAAIRHALQDGRKSVTIVHKGAVMKYTEGAFLKWAYEVAKDEFGTVTVPAADAGHNADGRLIIKDVIADIFLQHILTRPSEFDVIVTMNLNGDYISDALAAQIGGIGIAPGANVNYESGAAMFEATHGSAPKYADQDKANPSSLILSGVMMLQYLGWLEAADTITGALKKAFKARTVTYDLARFMRRSQTLKCSEFAKTIVDNIGLI